MTKTNRPARLTIDDAVPPKAKLNEQISHLRKELALRDTQIAKLHRSSGERQILATVIQETIDSLPPLAPMPYRVPRRIQHDVKMAAVLKLSDWHIGEVIRPEETENFGVFNWDIAQKRVSYIVQKLIAWTQTHRMAFNIPFLYVFCEQDFISGNIHKELEVTNEFPLPVQAVRAGQLLAKAIAELAPHFPEVRICECGGDNHSRLNPKPQAKQKATNSMGYIVYAIANELLRKHTNISVQEQEGMTFLANVVGQKFLLEHGDGVKGSLGFPWYGIARKKHREAFRRMLVRRKRDIGFDFMSFGHWHVPSIIEEVCLVNGSLSGTTEFDHSQGRHANPSQVSFLVSPKHGYFYWTAWKPRP